DLGVLLTRRAVTQTTLDLVVTHPTAERLRTEPKPTRDRGDRLPALPVHTHRLITELRRPLRLTTHPLLTSLPRRKRRVSGRQQNRVNLSLSLRNRLSGTRAVRLRQTFVGGPATKARLP